MTTHTIPAFTGKIQQGGSETKYESRVRNDMYASSRYASSRYAKRLDIDHQMEERRLQRELKEMEL